MNELITTRVALKPISTDDGNKVFGGTMTLPGGESFEIIYLEEAPKKMSGAYGDYYMAGNLSFREVDYLVYQREWVNSSTNEKYKYLSTTVERDKCYVTLRKDQPLSYKYSSDPKKRDQYTYTASVRYDENYFSGSESKAAPTEDLPF